MSFVPVQAVYNSLTGVTPGTYVLAAGIAGQSIKVTCYNISTTDGTIVVQDTSGIIVATILPNSNSGYNGIPIILTPGAGLEAIVSGSTTNVNYYLQGFQD